MSAAQGQEGAPGQTHLHWWHFQEINGPENSHVLSTVLMTTSGNENSHIYWGFKFKENRELSWNQLNVPHTDILYFHLSAQFCPSSNPEFHDFGEGSPQAVRTTRTAINSLCLGAGASRSTSSVQPDAHSALGWVGAPLQQALHNASCTAHVTGSASSTLTQVYSKLWIQT